MNPNVKPKVMARLNRARGQIDGVIRMLESDRYCVDVLTQISAAQAALGKAAEMVLEQHIESCVRDAFDSGKPERQREKIDELMEVFAQYSKSRR